MKILLLQLYLLIWCQATETLHQRTDLGQNVTINCDLDDGEIYWLLLKAPDPPVVILRTLPTTFTFFNKTLRQKYSVPSKNHLFINNVTSDELGVYYCMKKGTPPIFSNGTRLHVIEPTDGPNQEVTSTQQNDTVFKYTEQNQTTCQTLTITLALLSGVLIIVVIGLLKVFVVGHKRSGEQELHGSDPQQPQEHQDPERLQYAEVDFTKLRKKPRPDNAESTYAPLNLRKL